MKQHGTDAVTEASLGQNHTFVNRWCHLKMTDHIFKLNMKTGSCIDQKLQTWVKFVDRQTHWWTDLKLSFDPCRWVHKRKKRICAWPPYDLVIWARPATTTLLLSDLPWHRSDCFGTLMSMPLRCPNWTTVAILFWLFIHNMYINVVFFSLSICLIMYIRHSDMHSKL